MPSHRVGSNRSNTRRRHARGDNSVQRATHGGPFDPTGTTDALYGGTTGGEAIGWQDFSGEVIGRGNIQHGAIIPETFDTTPPAVPTDLAVTSLETLGSDGTTQVVLRVTWTNPSDADLHGTFIETTDDASLDGGGTADWTNPEAYFVGHEVQSLDIVGVVGNTEYFVRLNCVDIQGNRSGYTSTVSHTTARDTVAPAVPENVSAVAGFRGAILKWSSVQVSDLSDYVFRWAPDDGTGTAPNTGSWTEQRTKSTSVWVTGLTPDVRYWFAVQATDRSGNESDFSADVLAETSCVPTQIGAADIAANSVSAVHITTSGLTADLIKTGILALGTVDGKADGIEVYDSAATTSNKKVGQWDEDGIRVYASDDQSNYIHITEASLTVYKNGVAQTAITTDGIDATAINFGRLAGGHNLIPNSSFEVGAFSAETTVVNTIGPFVADDNTRCTKTGAVISITPASW